MILECVNILLKQLYLIIIILPIKNSFYVTSMYKLRIKLDFLILLKSTL